MQCVALCDWLLSLSVIVSGLIQTVAFLSTPSFLMLNNTPVHQYGILSIHSAAGGQLCSFHSWIFWITLPVTFCARCGCGYVCFSFSGIYLGVELLASGVTLCLPFWGTARLFTKLVDFHTPTSSVWGSHFPHILTSTYHLRCPGRWKRYLVVVLICISLKAVMLGVFIYLWRNDFEDSLPIWKYWVVFLFMNCKSSLYILGTNSLPDKWLANIFSHSVFWLSWR